MSNRTAASETLPFRPRILVWYCRLIPHGGGEGVAAWILEALRQDYAVTLLTSEPVDLSPLDRHFGTSLTGSDLQVRIMAPPVRRFLALDPDPGSIQKHAYLMRLCKRVRNEYDLVVGADNEGDFGPPAIQYIHWPFLSPLYHQVRSSCDLPFRSKLACLSKGEIRPWMLVADFSFDRMKANHTLVNSDWTGRLVKRVYGIDSTTVHPPAPGIFPEIAWEEREDGFIMMGRLAAGKRFDWCLKVLSVVRTRFPHIKMHIVGRSHLEARDYPVTLRSLAQANSSWVTLHEDLSRGELARLAARQRYGMHAFKNEHFGMAVAEMVRAGCIPFVHNSGGQLEIVGHDSRLIYESEEDAAQKIMQVLGDRAAQQDIRQRLALRKDFYSVETFMRAIRAQVEWALQARRSADPATRGQHI
jgi:glycosyltransferase involved in cell wall biosynthesis